MAGLPDEGRAGSPERRRRDIVLPVRQWQRVLGAKGVLHGADGKRLRHRILGIRHHITAESAFTTDLRSQVVEQEVREFMEQDQTAEDKIMGGTEHNAVGVLTSLMAVDHAGDTGLRGHVRHERNADAALAFEGAGQRCWGGVWRH